MREVPDSWRNGSLHPESPTFESSVIELYPALAFILDETRRELAAPGLVQRDSRPSQAELEQLVGGVARRLGFELAPLERDQILVQLDRDFSSFGPLQSLVDDPQVTDIIVRGYAQVDVQKGRQNYRSGVSFACEQSYKSFVERLLQRAGTTYSTKQPIADGMIDSFARLHAVHSSLCDGGPYLTIRLNRFDRVGDRDLLASGMLPVELMEYLAQAVGAGLTIMVVGEVGTGKTTLTRVLASRMPVSDSILVIEDTPEIKLMHPHVRYLRTRPDNLEGEGRISPSQCIRAGMRMAMNRIVFGEIRDAEAAEAFIDVCASGHPGISTIHARSLSDCITRLELFLGRAQPGVNKEMLTQQIAGAIQIVVYVNVCPESRQRRVIEVREINGLADGVLRNRPLLQYSFKQGTPRWTVKSRSISFREQLGEGGELARWPSELLVASDF